MFKKEYQRPDMQTKPLLIEGLLAGSTGATGEDAPWAAKEERDNSVWDE